MNVGIITVSDRASSGEYEDHGGPALQAEADKRKISRTNRHNFS